MAEISSDIVIAASAIKVWQAVVDFSRYPEWNPLIPKIKGRARIDSELEMHFRLDNGKTKILKRTVKTVAKYRELLLEGSYLFPGLCDGEYALILQETATDETRVIQRERFTGLFSFLAGMLSPVSKRGLRRMNEALREFIEGEEESEGEHADEL